MLAASTRGKRPFKKRPARRRKLLRNAVFVAVDVAGHRLNAGSRRVREDRKKRQALNAGTQA
jgi:hypothetical protein